MFPATISAKMSGWATYCERRSPTFKVHTSKGLAMSAVSDKRPDTPIALYRLEGENWVLDTAYPVPDNCERCGGSFIVDEPYGRYPRMHVQENPPGQSLKRYELPIICRTCYSEDSQKRRDAESLEREEAEYLRLKQQFEGR